MHAPFVNNVNDNIIHFMSIFGYFGPNQFVPYTSFIQIMFLCQVSSPSLFVKFVHIMFTNVQTMVGTSSNVNPLNILCSNKNKTSMQHNWLDHWCLQHTYMCIIEMTLIVREQFMNPCLHSIYSYLLAWILVDLGKVWM